MNRLQEVLINGFTTCTIQKKFEALSVENRKILLGYLSNGIDGIKLPLSSSLKTDYGMVSLKQRSNYQFNKRLLEHYIAKGEISLSSVLNVASFGESLKLIVGEDIFTLLSKNIPTSYIELRSNDAIKEIVEEKSLVFEVLIRNILRGV